MYIKTNTNVKNYENVQFIKDEEKPYKLIIVQYDQFYNDCSKIGQYDFLENEGYLFTINQGRKDYKRFKPLLNNFFKYNEFFMWNSKIVEDCKKEGLGLRKQAKKEQEREERKRQEKRASDYIKEVKKGNEKLLYVIKNDLIHLEDYKLIKVIKNNFKNKISDKTINDVYNTICQALKNN